VIIALAVHSLYFWKTILCWNCKVFWNKWWKISKKNYSRIL